MDPDTNPAPNVEGGMLNGEVSPANVEQSTSNTERQTSNVESGMANTEMPAGGAELHAPGQAEVAMPIGGGLAMTPSASSAADLVSNQPPMNPSPNSHPPVIMTGTNPVIADDVDVIEKEWVDRAEQVVKQTAGDPHAEEEAVEDLQIDYLKKRYGKEVKKSE